MIDRRELLKDMVTASTLPVAETIFPILSFAAPVKSDPELQGVTWKKTPCRFCGVGCGLLVGIKGDRAVAVQGDPASTVNKGLCCVKGYHSVLALYGKDRLRQALVRKNGKLVPVPMKEALDLVAAKMKETIAQHGKDSVASLRFGPMDDSGRLCCFKVLQRLHRNQQPGRKRQAVHVKRGYGLHDLVWNGRTDGLLRRHRSRGCLRTLGQ